MPRRLPHRHTAGRYISQSFRLSGFIVHQFVSRIYLYGVKNERHKKEQRKQNCRNVRDQLL